MSGTGFCEKNNALKRYFFVLAAMVGFGIPTTSAFAQPYLEVGYVDTFVDVPIDIWVDDYFVSGPAYLDYSTLTIELAPASGVAVVDYDFGVIDYYPDTGFEGFDYIKYTIADENGDLSNLAELEIYVEPAGGTNAKPIIVDYAYVYDGSTGACVVSGKVIDEYRGSLTVTLGDYLSATATTDANGNFSYSFTDSNVVGESITAQVTDGAGAKSDVVTLTVN